VVLLTKPLTGVFGGKSKDNIPIEIQNDALENAHKYGGETLRAVSRKRGCMPADSFVGIWKFVARPNLCEPPACVKPPPR